MAESIASSSAGSWRDFFAYFVQPKPWVSLSLVASLPIVFGVQVALLMQDLGGLHDSLFILEEDWPMEPWTLVFSRFAHKGFLHLQHNLVGLLLLGPIAERILGWRRFLGFYLLASIVAGVVAIEVGEILGVNLGADSSVGASGGVFATVGLLVVLVTREWGIRLRGWYRQERPLSWKGVDQVLHSGRPHELTALVVCGYQIWGLAQWQSTTVVGQTGNVAHLVGLLVGAGAGLWVCWRNDRSDPSYILIQQRG